MAIQVYCNCGNPLFVPAELAGRKIKCKNCGETLKVPQADSEAPDPEEAEKLQQSGRYEVVGGIPASARTKLAAAGAESGGGSSVQLSCPACGGKVEPEDLACLSCGAELSGGGLPPRSGVLGSVPRPVLFLVVAVVGFGGIGLAIWRAWLGSRPSAYAAEGNAALGDKDWARAEEMFLKSLEYDPTYSGAILGLAQVGAATHRSALVSKYAQKGIELCQEKPMRARIRMAWAEDLLQREKWRDAYNVANDAGRDDDSIKGVPAIKGIASLSLYEGAKADEEAYVHLKEAIAEGEQRDWRIYYHLARIQAARHELEEARPNAEKALEMEQSSADLWLLLAWLRESAGDKSGARAALAKVVELQPENAAAHGRLSRLYLEAGDAESARRSAEKAKELAPDSAEAALALGRANLSLERYGPAKEELERAVKGNAGWEAEFLLGQVYYALKDIKNGAQMLQRGLDKRREDGPLYQRAGQICLDAGDATTAITILQRGISIDGRSYEMRLLLARALGTSKDQRKRSDKQIVECLLAAKELIPSRPEAWQELAVQHVELGRPKDALEVLSAALEACPRNADLLYEKGRACVEAGDRWNEAIEALEELQKQKGSYKESERLLREAYEQRMFGGGNQ